MKNSDERKKPKPGNLFLFINSLTSSRRLVVREEYDEEHVKREKEIVSRVGLVCTVE